MPTCSGAAGFPGRVQDFRRRADPISAGYAPLGSGRGRQPTSQERQELRTHAAEAHRSFLARLHDVESQHGELLRATAAELTRAGATTLRTTTGDIEARIIRFRKEAVVLEIHYPGGRSQARSTQSTVGEASVHELASALASARPDAAPG